MIRLKRRRAQGVPTSEREVERRRVCIARVLQNKLVRNFPAQSLRWVVSAFSTGPKGEAHTESRNARQHSCGLFVGAQTFVHSIRVVRSMEQRTAPGSVHSECGALL